MAQECIAEGRLAAWCSTIPGESIAERRSEFFGRHVKGLTDPAIARDIEGHLAECEPCRAALEQERALAAVATGQGKIAFAVCPSSLEMLQYIERDAELGPWRRLEIRQHINQCAMCREEVSWASKRVVEKLPAAEALDAPGDSAAEAERNLRPGWFGWLSWKWAAVAATAAIAALFALVYPSQFGPRRFARYAQLPDVPYEMIRTEFAKAHPDEAAQFVAATDFVSVGEYRKGIGILADLKAKYSTDPSVDFFLGYVATREDRIQDALMLCIRAEKENNMHGYRCWYLANVAIKAGDLPTARRELMHAGHHELYNPGVERLEKIIN